MRLLILSDSHGDAASCMLALRLHPEAEAVIHLGDGEDDLNGFSFLLKDKILIQVRGNNAWGSLLPEKKIVQLGGKRIYVCHGHNEKVKMTTELLIQSAIKENCEIALFGHTHRQESIYLPNPLYLFNPGSIRAGEYGMIDIIGNQIICVESKL